MTHPRQVHPPAEPMLNAVLFRQTDHLADGVPLLAWQSGVWRRWDGTCWPIVEEALLDRWLYEFFADAKYEKDGRDGVEKHRFAPNEQKLRQLKHALRAICLEEQAVDPPAWRGTRHDPPAIELIPMANGLLHWPTRTLIPHDPNFWTFHSLPFDFDPDAGDPGEWLKFLESVWLGDQQAVDCLQEIFGYLISGDTRLQKIFSIFGPPRSGKGTIGRVIKALLGDHNVSGISTQALASQFGMQGLIGKVAAILADARLRSSQDVVVERMLNISGEDPVQIDRKYGEPWHGRLGTRFVLMSNELPRLADASGALASRFVVLTMEHTFLGREDLGLEDRLMQEIPAILNWSLTGLERLRDRGQFAPPDSSAELIEELFDLGAPVKAFLDERCTIEVGQSVPAAQLYLAWRAWCDNNGRDHKGTRQTFGRDLRAAVPGVKTSKRRSPFGREVVYEGIGIDAGAL